MRSVIFTVGWEKMRALLSADMYQLQTCNKCIFRNRIVCRVLSGADCVVSLRKRHKRIVRPHKTGL